MPDDDLVAALVRAIAGELIQLGYQPAKDPGFLDRGNEHHVRVVADATWQAMNEIIAASTPSTSPGAFEKTAITNRVGTQPRPR